MKYLILVILLVAGIVISSPAGAQEQEETPEPGKIYREWWNAWGGEWHSGVYEVNVQPSMLSAFNEAAGMINRENAAIEVVNVGTAADTQHLCVTGQLDQTNEIIASPLSGNTLGVACASFGVGDPDGDGYQQFAECDIVIDNDGSYSFDIATVLAHEIGHCIGLAHSEDPNSLMYASYHGPMDSLSEDDITGLQAIYGVEDASPTPTPTPTSTPSPTPSPTITPEPEYCPAEWGEPLEHGWNNVASLADDYNAELLENCDGIYIVFYFDSGSWDSWVRGFGRFNDLETIDQYKAYWVYVR